MAEPSASGPAKPLLGHGVTQATRQSELLDPATINRIGRLELIATRVVEGFISGKHRSPYKGGSIEFSEHRHYTPGDELRQLDWRAFARSDRYYIKQFREETNLQATLVLDASGSMAFGRSTVTKLDYARVAAACLSRLMLLQRDAVGMATIDTKVRFYLPPRSRPGHFQALVKALETTKAGGETSLAENLADLALRIKRRGLVVLCSDCFDDVDKLLNILHRLRLRGHEVLLFHFMAPEELSFPFNRWSRFECLEVDGRRIDVDPVSIRKGYLRRLGEFLDALRQGCNRIECDYVPITTDKPLGDTLAFYLARRAARMK